MSNTGKEVEQTEKDKRIYQVSLMLRRKPVSFIVDFIKQNWGLERTQAYNYIKSARNEWRKYFEKLKSDGISYHIAQIRDLKDKAFIEADTRLVLDITKEEAKLMGIYPSEKHDVKFEGELIITDAKRKLVDKIAGIVKRTGEDEISK